MFELCPPCLIVHTHWSISAWVLWIEDALLAASEVDLNWIMRVD
jgi:hypothetical protein